MLILLITYGTERSLGMTRNVRFEQMAFTFTGRTRCAWGSGMANLLR